MSSVLFQQIAQKVGVSPRTVQRILNSQMKDTRPAIVKRAAQIRALADEMNYRPNSAAKAVASGRFGSISLIRPAKSQASHYTTDLMDAIVDALAHHDMHLILHRFPDETLLKKGFIPKVLTSSMSDGLLVNYTHQIPPQLLKLLKEDPVPAIWMNAQMKSDCIYPDDVAAGRLATEQLLERGCPSVGYVHFGTSGHYSERDRRNGYLSAMKHAGLKPHLHEVHADDLDWLGVTADHPSRLELAMRWMKAPGRPAAAVAYGDSTAYSLLLAAAACGLRIPEDFGLVTIGDHFATDSGIPITTVVFGADKMGRGAVELVMEKIRHPDVPLKPVVVPCHVVAGKT